MTILGRGIGLSFANYSTAAWTPTSLPSLNSWFRADSNVTLNGSTVSAIGDKSGAAVLPSLAQSIAGQQPLFVASGINALNDITWGANTALPGNQTLLGTTAITIALILKSSQAATARAWGMSFNGSQYSIDINRSTLATKASFGVGGSFASSNGSVTDNLPHVVIGTWSTLDNTVRIYVDGTTAATSTGTFTGPIVHAGTDENAAGSAYDTTNSTFVPYVGNMPEWLSASAVPSASDLTKLWTYLRGRAGI